MSWPGGEHRPRPPRITTRTSSSASARRKASFSSTSIPRFWALRASGRFSMIRTIRPSSSVSYSTNLYSGIVPPDAGRKVPGCDPSECDPTVRRRSKHELGLPAHGTATGTEAAQRRVRRAGGRRQGAVRRCRARLRGCGPAGRRREGDGTPTLDASLGDGPLLGKRYADDETGLELLCTGPATGVDRRRPPAPGQGRQAACPPPTDVRRRHEPAAPARHGRRGPRRRGRGAGGRRPAQRRRAAGRGLGRPTSSTVLPPWPTWAPTAWPSPSGCSPPRPPACPFVPLNYRLSDEQLHDLLAPLGDALVVAEGERGRGARRPGPPGAHRRGLRGHRPRRGAGATCPPTARAGRAALHQRHHVGAPKAAVLRHRHLAAYVIGTGRVRGRRARRGRAGERAAVPRGRAGQPAEQPLPRAGGSSTCRSSTPAPGSSGAARRSPTPWWCPPCWPASATPSRPTAGACPRCARCPTAGRARRPPCCSGPCGCCPTSTSPTPTGSPRPARPSRCSGPDDHRAARDGDPVAAGRLSSAGRVLPGVEVEVRGPIGEPLPAGRARRDLGAGRAGVGRVRRRGRRRSTPPAGSPPATAAGSTPTATCSSRAAATTRSSAAARTSPRPRSRRCCSSTPTSPSARWSASPTTSGASASPPWWCPGPAPPSTPPRSRPSPGGRCGARRRPRSSASSRRCPTPRRASCCAGSSRPTSCRTLRQP